MKRVTRRPRPAQGDGTDRGSPLADSDEAVQVDASANRRRVPGARRGHLDLVLRYGDTAEVWLNKGGRFQPPFG